jgi:hypothetical protein
MGLIGRVWAEIGGDASGLKNAARESIGSLEDLRKAAANLGLSNVSDDFLKLNKNILSTANTSSSAATIIGGAFGNVALAIAGINQGIELAKKGIAALKEVWDFTTEGAQIASLEQASYKLAQSYGTNMADIVSSVKSASLNTISDYEIMRDANRAMTMGISTNANELAQLIQIAEQRGRAFGLTTEEAFNQLTVGIGRRFTRTLMELGFSADQTRINREYADSIGKTTTELSDNERVRALFLNVLKEGNAELDKEGGLVMDVYTPYQRLNTVIANFWDNVKSGAAYTGAMIIASKEENKVINDQAASYALLTGNYYAYQTAMLRGAQGGAYVNKQGIMVTPEPMLTERGFNLARRKQAEVDARMSNFKMIGNETVATNEIMESMKLEIGLTGELAKAQEEYNETLQKYGKRSAKAKESAMELGETYDDFILSALSDLGADSKATLSVGYAFGEIDDKSMAAFTAIQQLYDEYSKTGDIEQLTGKLQGLRDRLEGLDKLKIDDKSMTFTIYVRYLVNGSMVSLNTSAVGNMSNLLNETIDLSQGLKRSGGMHGGTFIGMQHGGIIPPGYSNDGFPLWVSSGERVDVTPAGNKKIESGGTTNRFYGPVTLQVDSKTSKDILRELKQ